MIDHEDYQAIFPTVLFYARRAILREAIFVSDRLDTQSSIGSGSLPMTIFFSFTWFWLQN